MVLKMAPEPNWYRSVRPAVIPFWLRSFDAGWGTSALISACCTRSGYAFTVSVITWLLERIASSVENVLNPCFLRSEEHTSELQSPCNLVCRLLLEKKNYIT